VSLLVLSLTLLTVTLSAFAQLALKMGVSRPPMAAALQSGVVDAMITAALSPLIWTGLIIYVLSVSLWLWVLSKVDLSVAYPFVGISFLVTMVFGALLLNENVTPMRIIGTLLIAGGCVLVAKSS
jgi:drug/metabolite transporter (DMT)-like permease